MAWATICKAIMNGMVLRVVEDIEYTIEIMVDLSIATASGAAGMARYILFIEEFERMEVMFN